MTTPQKWPDRIHWLTDQLRQSVGTFAFVLANEHTANTVRLIENEGQNRNTGELARMDCPRFATDTKGGISGPFFY
jgi:hypothetical protein